MSKISGAYTYTAKIGAGTHTSIGGTEDGFEILVSPQMQEIKDDEFGENPVDAVDLGQVERVRFTFIDYDLIEPVLNAARTLGDPKAKVGRLLSSSAIEIIATPVAGTPAAAHKGPYTFYKAIPDGDYSILLSSRHRKGPMTFLLLPSASNSNKTYNVASAS